MGRPTKGLQLMDSIVASQQAHERAKAILLTLTGEWTVEEAMAYLGVSRTRFAQLRRQLLQGALAALEGGRTGRPRHLRTAAEDEVVRLEALISSLHHQVRTLAVEVELLRGPAREAVLAHQGGGR